MNNACDIELEGMALRACICTYMYIHSLASELGPARRPGSARMVCRYTYTCDLHVPDAHAYLELEGVATSTNLCTHVCTHVHTQISWPTTRLTGI